VKRIKKFKVIYQPISIDQTKERIDSTFDYLFRKVADIEIQKYGK